MLTRSKIDKRISAAEVYCGNTSANENDVIRINEELRFPSARDNNWHSYKERTNVFTLTSAIDEKKLTCRNDERKLICVNNMLLS